MVVLKVSRASCSGGPGRRGSSPRAVARRSSAGQRRAPVRSTFASEPPGCAARTDGAVICRQRAVAGVTLALAGLAARAPCGRSPWSGRRRGRCKSALH